MDNDVFAKHLNLLRRLVQGLVIAVMIALLLSRQVAVDPEAPGISFFGRMIWFHEVGLLLLALATPFALLAGLSIVMGRAFCGWCCPQTPLCELASAAHRLIVSSRSQGTLRFAAAVTGVVGLGLVLGLGGGLALASILVSPEAVLGLARGEINTSLLKGITIATLLILVDIGLLRHSFCEWLCVFGWWQRLFGSNKSLRVAFATERARECLRCDECHASCFMGIDPRRRNLPKSCLNCGLCISACSAKMASVGAETLVSYQIGKAQPERARAGTALALAKGAGALGLLLVVGGLVSWAILARDIVQVKVRQEAAVELVNGAAHGEYTVDLYNNGRSPLAVELGQSGLPVGSVLVHPNPVTVAPHARGSTRLSFRADVKELHPGRNEFWVNATAGENASRFSYRVVFGLPVVLPERLAADNFAEAASNAAREGSYPYAR